MARVIYVLPHLNINGGVKVVLQHAHLLRDTGIEVLVTAPTVVPSPFSRYQATIVAWDEVDPQPDDTLIFNWFTDLRRFGAEVDCRRIYFAQSCYWCRRHPDGRQPDDDAVKDLDVYHQGDILAHDVEIWSESREIQRYFLYGFGRESRLVHNWIDTSLFTPAPERRVLGRVGMLSHRDHGYVELLDAFRAAGLDTVCLEGDEEEIARGLQECELFISGARGEPNGWRRTEGFPLPMAEAMACGCVVVTFDTGGCGDYLIEDVNGVVVWESSISALIAATIEASRREDRAQLGERAAETFRVGFGAERIKRMVLDALRAPVPVSPPPPLPPMTAHRPASKHGTVILSPHSDDAALCVGGALQKEWFRPPVTLVTLFGRSNYAADGGFHDEWRQVTATRRQEDEAFAASLDVPLWYFQVLEVGLRGVPILVSEDATLEQPAGLEMALREVLAATRPREIVLPLAIGGHVDHVVTRRTAIEIAAEYGAQLLFYEDLPYAIGLSEDEMQRHVAGVGLRLEPEVVTITDVLDRKRAALALYPSQLDEDRIDAIARYRLEDGEVSERLWRARV